MLGVRLGVVGIDVKILTVYVDKPKPALKVPA
jgi:hypothetical protein